MAPPIAIKVVFFTSFSSFYFFARASGSGRSIAIGLSVCLSHHVHNVLIVHNVLNLHPTNHAQVFREFSHLHTWCQHDCGRSLLSTIALFFLL